MEYTGLILLLPLLSFIALGLLGTKLRPIVAGSVGTAVLGVCALLAYITAATYFSMPRIDGAREALVPFRMEWLHFTDNLGIELGILLDPISVMMLVVITTVSLMVHIYSLGYMHGERGFQRYYSFLSLFTFSMLGLVVATNIFQMYIFWELVGVSSYLLIGFYYTKPEAVAASKKAFIVTRFADLGFLIGILILSYYTGTFSFEVLNSGDSSLFATAAGSTFMGCSVISWAMALIFMGGAGKSAMFPLHIWLPDAMEGPTPVSALIHAATMVVAGVYLVARLFPVYHMETPEVLVLIAVVGAFTSLYAAVVKKMPSLDEEARTDIVNWLGAHHAASQIDVVVAMIGSNNGELAAAAIRAAGKIGGQTALDALIAQLGGPHAEEASQALRAFNGDATEGLLAALDGTPATQEQALKLVGLRRITKASDKVFDLLASNDTAVHDAAVDALAGVSTMADFERLCTLLDKASGTEVAKYQAALTNALSTQEPDVQYAKVSERMKSAPEQTRYYTLLAQSGSREAIDALLAAENREAAFDALLKVDNSEMIDVLYELATTNPAWTDNALSCYTDFVASHAAPEQRPALYEKGLQANPSAAVQNKLLRALANTYSFPSIATAAAYLDNPETAEAAAFAVKTIAAKHPGKGGDEVVKTLEKARDVYAALAKTDADAGYAVDEIKGLLTKYAEAPRFELSPEEAAEGFEVLFDGHSLEKWTGNKINYVPLNGTIDVTAQYGGSGNLYTKKEYSDFILRFEFSFIRPGVNNGIGIRTPMGVDAAFDGMEIQVLDHDDPIYKNINVYQQHGSVYGVIAAKRVKFGELGTWNVEEIRAVGDHITVTVNGEVILDGNIREACKGHNVAPDGSTKNPYTVDGRNHPGLFNKKGHIGLLGHGAGIQFRNIRIKEL